MTKSLYELLGVGPTASADEIKRAFRREIAKYHPDKVQHLGREFQEIAAVRSAELTTAYRTLTDPSLRADYDAGGETPVASTSAPPPPPSSDTPRATAASTPPPAEPRPAAEPRRAARPEPRRAQDHGGAGDLVRRASIARFRQALEAEFGGCEETPVTGFDIACAPPKGRFWARMPPRVLVRFVGQVDASALAESWSLASRMRGGDQRDVCVFVIGPAVAPARELAEAIAGQLQRPAPGRRLTVIPVNANSWTAHIPNDTPPAAKSLLGRLKSL